MKKRRGIMSERTHFTANIEIELYYHDSQGNPDISYEYATSLPKLLELCSEPYLMKLKRQYHADMVKVGKIELVSLSQEGEFSIQVGKQKIEINQEGIIETKSMRE
jgi:hypothetical protein